jgi:hypothetical protein
MSRTEAKRRFTLDDHAKATAGVECRKDADVIDETPMAYKSIDAVMEAQHIWWFTGRTPACSKPETSPLKSSPLLLPCWASLLQA